MVSVLNIFKKSAMAHDDDIDVAEGKDDMARIDDDVGISCTLDMFREYEEVKQMLTSIEQAVETDLGAEKAFEDLTKILDSYQEQPHLLDPYLEQMLTELIKISSAPDAPSKVTSQAFKYLWLIIKVRGYKNVSRKLPHEVNDLIPVLEMMECEEEAKDFYRCFVLLLWLSIIVYMPFNMKGFDATVKKSPAQSASPTVVERLMSVIKTHLKSSQQSREMAAFVASKFITRPDLREKYVPEFFSYCFDILCNDQDPDIHNIFHKLGVLRALGLIFKHGKREEMLPYSKGALMRIIESKSTTCIDTPVRKLAMKLIQRIGLTFLKPKVATWRYQMGSRSLSINIQGASSQDEFKKDLELKEHCDDDDDEVAAEVEEVIDCLLQGLKDKDTIVRWSAAKGIGRVTGRLPQEFADEVVGAILDNFSTRESDKAWHGGCLALAELARRGLLLPERLPAIAPILERALVYDELRGQCSVGSNIRDAACYLCWAFARAYHPDQMLPYVKQIATGLLIVALFDREIPCRRAGSAAFQEHVGRQGTFPHGIEILTTVDYFAVGNRSNAFLNLGVEVGKYPEYTQALIDHLVERKVNHWDSAIRELAAKALHNLTALAPDYMNKTIARKLLQESTGPVLVARHGAIMALAYITHALALVAEKNGKNIEHFMDNDVLEGIRQIVPTLEERKLYRGMGGEYMKHATAILIEKASLAKLPFHGQDILDKWYELLEDCIVRVDENLRNTALTALPPFWVTYFKPTTEANIKWRNNLINHYTEGLNTEKEMQSLGYVSALGCLPHSLVTGKFDIVLPALIKATDITSSTAGWAQTRKEAILGIERLVDTVGIEPKGKVCDHVCEENLLSIYQCLLKCLDDYTMDRRGDIGAWVREASMSCLQHLTMAVIKKDPALLKEDIVCEMMARICQQAVERIDRTRKVAGTAFASLLYSSPKLPHIPNCTELEKIFPKDECVNMNWAAERSTFRLFVELVDLPAYRFRVLLGVTYSAGGISANLSRFTSEAIHMYLNSRAESISGLSAFLETLLQIFANHQKVDRITLPLIKMLGDLLSSSVVLDTVLEQNNAFTLRIITLLKKECFRSADYHKLVGVVAVFCELLRIEGPSIKPCLTQLSLFLGYQYPNVRAVTATSFLTALQDYSDKEIVPENHLEEITNILEETEWMDDLEEARRQRNRLCELIDIPIPQPRKK
ncbi:tubulin-specific chaperone D-like isoform X2 [Macrobrachium nipponense]|uniref:tubulin-specific chaperone D-like isoform X2 n=1 Tax=Macrobrachium nipponense TaxID=159736 RepID=UPI0030C85910